MKNKRLAVRAARKHATILRQAGAVVKLTLGRRLPLASSGRILRLRVQVIYNWESELRRKLDEANRKN